MELCLLRHIVFHKQLVPSRPKGAVSKRETKIMTKVDLKGLLSSQSSNVALVVGNGINRFGAAEANSWDSLLMQIAADCRVSVDAVPRGTTLTEFYDVLNLKTTGRTGDLAAKFCTLMAKWEPLDHHKTVMDWAGRHAVPVLTTNFDDVLSRATGAEFLLPRGQPFSDFYPWNTRFAHELVDDPCAAFGIWHINGMARYKRSIRLGLTDYMGSVQRARGMFYRGDKRLFRDTDKEGWEGASSWLQLVFHKPLLFVGLALEENEVFLRWLLIERARYFRKFPVRYQPAWYVFTHNSRDEREEGKIFFLNAVGVTCVSASDYDEIWRNPGWAG